MHRSLFYILTSLLILQTTGVFAQKFEKYTTADGLSLDNVDCIAQDDEGYMYFGADMLNLFDGSSFSQISTGNNNQLSYKAKTILPLTNSMVLFGSEDLGLFLFDKKINKVYSLKINNILPRTFSVLSLHLDSEDKVWIGTIGKGVYHIEKSALTNFIGGDNIHFKKLDDFKLKSITTISSSNNRIWIGTKNNGVYYAEKANIHLNNQIYTLATTPKNILDLKIYNKTLFIGSEDGLILYTLEGKKLQTLLQNPQDKSLDRNIIRSIVKDKSNTIWAGTQHDGLYSIKFNGQETEIKNYRNEPSNSLSLNSNSILSLYLDKHENLWIGTWNGGINKLDLRGQQFVNIRRKNFGNNLSKNMIWCVSPKDEVSYWLGSQGSGLCVYNKGDNSFIEDQDLNFNGSVSKIFKDTKAQILYLGMWGDGIKAFSLENKKAVYSDVFTNVLLKNDRIYSITQDKDDVIWIGTIENGIFSFNPKMPDLPLKHFPYFKELETEIGLGEAEIRCILPDENNILWIASYNYGLFKAVTDNNGNIWEITPVEVDIKENSKNKIRNLYQSKDGKIWMGMKDGVKFYNKKSNSVESPVNLEDGSITDFQEDDDENFWISTYKGLIHYNRINGEVTKFETSEIFYDLYFNPIRNEMVAGTNKGIVFFDRSAISNNPYYPEIVFLKLKIFGNEILPGDSIHNRIVLKKSLNYINTLVMPYRQNIFSIDVATLYYSQQDKISIYHQLENFEDGWTKRLGSNSTISYTNLSPGKYILKVKVANKDGVWNPTIKELTIIILPPWWKTTWAYLAYILFASIIGVFIKNEIRNRVRLKHDLQIEKVKQEKDHEINQLKMIFFTNISHEIRTPLTLILSPLEDILSNETKETWIYHQHQIMFKNANLLLRLVNQILDFRKIENKKYKLKYSNFDIINFVNNIITQFEGIAETENIKLKFAPENKSTLLWGDPNKLDQVFFNLLSNAFKYTPKNGEVEVRIKSLNNSVYIEVKDTGTGISSEDLPHIFERFYQAQTDGRKGTGIGLAVVKSIINFHAGDIEVQSEINRGTIFKIKLPLGNKHLPEGTVEKIEKETINPDKTIEIQEPAESTISDSKKIKILTIDDNDDIRTYLKESLSVDYTVYEAQNGKEGIEKALKLLPSIIICDVMMEGIDGIEVCSTLKSNVNTSHIPIILLTAKEGVENKIEGFEKGADAYITKPFSLKLLKARILNLIEQRNLLKQKINKLNINLSSIGPTSIDEKFLNRLISIMEENMSDSTFLVNELAESLGMSHDQLYRKIKVLTGLSANKFVRTIRLRKAAKLIGTKKYNIAEVLYEVGFSSPSYFSKCFKDKFGVVPSEYKGEKKS